MKKPSANPVGLFSTFDASSLYEEFIILFDEFVSFTSECPNGPYIGLPSNAQPIIGEWLSNSLSSNSLFNFSLNVFSPSLISSSDAVNCEYPKIPKFNEFGLDTKCKSPNLFWLLTVNSLTLVLNLQFFPLDITFAVVLLSYPIPEFITTVPMIDPFDIIGLTIAPAPFSDVNSISGNELYSLPWLVTITLIILPLSIIGLTSAFFPFSKVISGITWWFNVFEP